MKLESYPLYYLTVSALSVFFLRKLIDDIFIASLPGNYKKAFNRTIRIKANHSFRQRLSQRYIGEYVIQEHKKAYQRIISTKMMVIILLPVKLAITFFGARIFGEDMTELLCEIIAGFDLALSIFLLMQFDTNRESKYTRNK